MVHSSTARLAMFAAALFVFFCLGATVRDLTFPDELRYAEVAREMLESRNWILPKLNYQTYADKPPLHFWFLSSAMGTFGANTLAALLPSALSAILTILVTYWFGKSLFDPEVAAVAAWILGSLFLFLLMAQVVRMDIVLTLLTTAGLAFFHRGLQDEKRGSAAVVAGFACMGMAMITKGPVGLIVTMIPLFSYAIMSREIRSLRKLYTGRGLLVMAAIPLLWLIPAVFQGGRTYLYELVVRQNLGRVVGSFAHAEPFYYYFVLFPLLFAPWGFYLMLYLDGGIRKHLAIDRSAVLFLVCWVAGLLLFFSVLSGKKGNYILPLTPGLALLVARAYTPLLKQPRIMEKPFLFKVSGYLLAVSLCACAVTIPTVKYQVSFMNDWRTLIPSCLILALGGLLLFHVNRRMYIRRNLALVGVISILLYGSVSFWLIPRINPYLSLKPIAARILTHQGERPRVGGYKLNLKFLAYYLHAPYQKLRSESEVRDFVQDTGTLLIADAKDLSLMRAAAGHPLAEIGRFQVKKATYILLKRSDVFGTDLAVR
jgi:4-amino-4-deoxy-L-arabinose transferase-like glycosyltransferase